MQDVCTMIDGSNKISLTASFWCQAMQATKETVL